MNLNYRKFCSDPCRRFGSYAPSGSAKVSAACVAVVDAVMEASEVSEFEAIKSVAGQLNISEESAHRWRRKGQADADERSGMTSSEHAESLTSSVRTLNYPTITRF